ncbi:MAG TPA: DUF1461 domain-containing protein [Aggregatilineales bacterium]|nr:DUF1461 domain-containing protein [Anaerolineales bacterium]HRE46746.1 DUF1461 domain-containing protein [Aggregatilineales bacterium]
MTRLKHSLTAFFTLTIPLFLVLGGIRLLVTPAYTRLVYAFPNIAPDPYGFTTEERRQFAVNAVDYLLSGEDVDVLRRLSSADGQILFNERELGHMVDVKVVMNTAFQVGLGVFMVGVLIFFLLPLGGAAKRQMLRRGMVGGGGLALILLAALIVYILIDWNQFFNRFHDLFFAPGTWQFRYSDGLIRLFPIPFWQNAALSLGLIVAIGAGALIGGAVWWGRRVGKTSSDHDGV